MIARDLWPGADVRWIGAETTCGGVRLRPGDRAVVLDPGAHHLTSAGPLYQAARLRHLLRRGGVLIRTASGQVARTPRAQLELVAPNHPLSPEPQASVAAWFLDELETTNDGSAVATVVPRRFPSVCQVLHAWQQVDEAGRERYVSWAEVVDHAGLSDLEALLATGAEHGGIPEIEPFGQATVGELDRRTAQALVDVLGSATTTPDQVYFAVWTGHGDVPVGRFPGAAVIDTVHGGYFLLRGPLEGALTTVSIFEEFRRPVSGLWWPADRAWLVATEIEAAWTLVAGDEELPGQLQHHPHLEVLPTSMDDSKWSLPASSSQRGRE